MLTRPPSLSSRSGLKRTRGAVTGALDRSASGRRRFRVEEKLAGPGSASSDDCRVAGGAAGEATVVDSRHHSRRTAADKRVHHINSTPIKIYSTREFDFGTVLIGVLVPLRIKSG